MNKWTQFLLDWFLFKKLGQAFRKRIKQAQDWLNGVKPFSWEAMLLLSLFSWFVYLLLTGFYAKKLVSVFAWLFLIVGIDWALLGKSVRLPLIGFKFQYGPWITGGVAALALLSNDFILTDWQSAITSWPIISAVFAAYSRFIQPGLKLGPPAAAARQDLVLLFLISGLLSSWFQFHFLIQDTLARYPNLLADSFERSAFVTRINLSRRPTTKAYALLTATEAAVRQSLTGKNWIDSQRWLSTIKAQEPELGRQAIAAVYSGPLSELLREQALWEITTDAGANATNPTSLDLILRARWQGASSRPGGYTLRQVCLVSEAALPNPQTFEQLRQSGFQLTCQQATEEQAG